MSDLFGRGTMIVAPILQCKGKESAPSLRRKLKKKPFLRYFADLFCGILKTFFVIKAKKRKKKWTGRPIHFVVF
jgi:hypothetical protein